ncbi:hypothetical protein H6G93_33400 [Nostoc sp. FACHB-973]|nr:hypothetical protein [Nostoc sp. FACHB-973]
MKINLLNLTCLNFAIYRHNSILALACDRDRRLGNYKFSLTLGIVNTFARNHN